MNGRRAVVGLCMLCALAFSAVAAAGASADTGTTAFTCAPVSTAAMFKDAHCKETSGTGVGFSHKSFTGETAITLTNVSTGAGTTSAEPTFLHAVLGGIELELKSEEVTGTGKMINSLTGEAHKASGSGTILYKKVTVVKPAEKGCKVNKEEVPTKELAAETVGETGLKFSPKSGTTFAEVIVEGCTITSLNKTYPVTGSIIGTPEGATTVFTRAGTTAQGTLKMGGQNAGLNGKVTIKGPSGAGLSLTKSPFTHIE